MELRVLGKSPAWQDAGGVCSGYLVVADGTCLLLDCGSGVFGELRSVVGYAPGDAAGASPPPAPSRARPTAGRAPTRRRGRGSSPRLARARPSAGCAPRAG